MVGSVALLRYQKEWGRMSVSKDALVMVVVWTGKVWCPRVQEEMEASATLSAR